MPTRSRKNLNLRFYLDLARTARQYTEAFLAPILTQILYRQQILKLLNFFNVLYYFSLIQFSMYSTTDTSILTWWKRVRLKLSKLFGLADFGIQLKRFWSLTIYTKRRYKSVAKQRRGLLTKRKWVLGAALWRNPITAGDYHAQQVITRAYQPVYIYAVIYRRQGGAESRLRKSRNAI